MNAEEQDAAILRLVKERAEAKRERALIEAEIKRLAELLLPVANALRDAHLQSLCENQVRLLTLLEQLDGAISGKRAMLQQFFDLSERVRQYDLTARALGID